MITRREKRIDKFSSSSLSSPSFGSAVQTTIIMSEPLIKMIRMMKMIRVKM
ncbi:MAG: hypothetical protein KAH48_11525 [Chlorobi bacterium]|nr:hypothetical protein [Chlorobiota bacterium]